MENYAPLRIIESSMKQRLKIDILSRSIDKLKGAKYFMKLDVQWGYNNVQIKEGDKWKVAF